MDKIIVLFCVVHLGLIIQAAEIPDVNEIYNIPAISDYDAMLSVDVEIHSMSNSLGKLFHLGNYTILSPISSRSIPSFDCFPTSQSCEWRSEETWTSSHMNHQQFKDLLLPLHDFDLPCAFNNGNCQIFCQNKAGRSLCYCPPDFILNEEKKTCSEIKDCHHVLTADSGIFATPNYPNNYYSNLNCTWLIVTSKERRINLNISTFQTEVLYDLVTVFDETSKKIAMWYGSLSRLNATSGNIMMVHFKTDHSVEYSGFEAVYSTEPVHSQRISELQSERGLITSTLNNLQPNLCLSLVYSLPPSGSVNIYADQSVAGITHFRQIHTNEINGWHISRYVSSSSLDVKDNSTKLSVLLTGRNSKILNIAECTTNDEDVYVLPEVVWIPSNRKYPNSTNDLSHIGGNRTELNICIHGGTYDKKSDICVCPPGFAGPNCTEACGPNHFGLNCSGLCSSFQKGCKNIMFCNSLNTCSCAAGFTGMNCEKECEPGTYGANCHNLCGKCDGSSCDKYTGECNDGCEDGYYPPLCQHRYAFLSQAPNVKETSWYNVLISIDFSKINGLGTPYLYQVEYKKTDSNLWKKTLIQEVDSRSTVLANVKDLNSGTQYILRVVVICEDGNSYKDFDIPTVQFETKCLVPNSNVYEMKSRDITSHSFTISWNYPVHSDQWCPISSFEIILQHQWRNVSQLFPFQINHTAYSTLLPAQQYRVYACAITKNGKPPCSHPFTITTQEKVPGKVNHLAVESRNAKNIQVSWKRPLFTRGIIKGYRIQYECVTQFICEESCRNSSGHLETTERSINLINLLPHVQYKIRVAAFSSSQGPFTSLFATTKSTKPEVSPIASDQPIVSRSNTSVNVQWQPPSCSGRNGQLTGYHFILTERGTANRILQTGTTKDVQTRFTSLNPMTEYQVTVFAMNSHGWNPNFTLIISFTSSATVPEGVQNLQVYKKGRRMLGIRWAKPSKIYGTLKSFTISYHQNGSENKFTQTVSPNACSGWPHLFCHDINTNLQPDKQYIVSVTARNNEIDENGMASEINATTRENAPEAPSSLKISRSTATTFEMEWGLPNMFNGDLRSFLVNVEHIDSLNETECCEYFPVQELPVREESPVYNLEVTGLNPASTYIVSVSAKTITMGPSVNATYYTAPLPPTDIKSPQFVGVTDDGSSYLLKIQPANTLPNSNSTYLLLVLPPGESPPPAIWEKELLEKLTQKTKNASFYIVSEFPSAEFVNMQEVKIGTGSDVKNGTLGQLMDPKFTAGAYKVGLAVVQWFGQAFSVGIAMSNRIEFGKVVDMGRFVG